jgi:outer membrane protein TolC
MNGLWLVGALLTQTPTTTDAPTRPAQENAAQTPSPAQKTAQAQSQLPLLTFEEALRQAQTQSYDLKQARARLTQAQEAGRRAWAGYLPTATVGATFTRNSNEAILNLPDGTVVPIQKYNQFNAQGRLSQAIIAPALFAGIKAAYQSERVAELNTENQRREILFGVAQAYYSAVALKEAASVQQHLLDIDRARTHDAEVRFQTGTSPKIALLRAQIDLSKAEQDVLRATNSYLSAKSALAALLGRKPDFDVERPPEPQAPDTDQGSLEKKAATERPDVRAAAAAVDLASTQKTGAWLSYLPTLGATAQYNWSNSAGFTGSSTSWAIVLALNWTVWDGGLRESDVRTATAKIVESQAALDGLKVRAREEVRQALLELDSARANRVKAAQTVSLARENLKLVHASVQAGAGTYLDEEDATAQLINAELSLVSETLNAHLAVLKVARAAGTFNPVPAQKD